VASVTIPLIVGQLRQANQHLDRARAMIAAALTELGHADTLTQKTLGNVRDQSVYATVARTKQLLTEAGQNSNQTTQKINEWIARIDGTSSRR
jgi:hypothetical protein